MFILNRICNYIFSILQYTNVKRQKGWHFLQSAGMPSQCHWAGQLDLGLMHIHEYHEQPKGQPCRTLTSTLNEFDFMPRMWTESSVRTGWLCPPVKPVTGYLGEHGLFQFCSVHLIGGSDSNSIMLHYLVVIHNSVVLSDIVQVTWEGFYAFSSLRGCGFAVII